MERDLLRNAEREAARRHLDRMLVVDADVHHLAVLKFLAAYLDRPWRRIVESAPTDRLQTSDSFGDRGIAGRIQRGNYAGYGRAGVVGRDEGDPPAPVRALVDDMSRIGVHYSVIFPNDMLGLGMHPQPAFEVAVSHAYARWLTERVLPHEPRVGSLLYLPIRDPAASLELIEAYAGRPGIVGFLIGTKQYGRLHESPYMRIYDAVQEADLALGFHGGGGNWLRHPYPVFDSFLAAHALSFPTYNAVHLVNLVCNGVLERFPRLRVVFFEAGAAWLPMLMGRLDTAYRMRPSEAPLLTRLPSEYLRDVYYTVQPIECPERPDQMQAIFEEIGCRQILFASDYPHWDFDMPSTITDLHFLSEEDKRDILGLNAVRAFNLKLEDLTPLVAAADRR